MNLFDDWRVFQIISPSTSPFLQSEQPTLAKISTIEDSQREIHVPFFANDVSSKEIETVLPTSTSSVYKHSSIGDSKVNDIEMHVQNESTIQPSTSVSEKSKPVTKSTRKDKTSFPHRNIIIKEDKYRIPRARKIVMSYTKSIPCSSCYIFTKGNIYRYPNDISTLLKAQNDHMDVTMVSVLSEERIPFIPYLIKSWEGPVVLSLFIPQEKVAPISEQLRNYSLPASFCVLIMVRLKGVYIFPINKLRNQAIQLVRTSHYLVFDMDMFPSSNLYSQLVSLPSELTESKENVFVVPSIFLNRNSILQSCTSLMSCLQLSLRYIPKSKQELYYCILNGTCAIHKGNGINKNHMLVSYKWIGMIHPSTNYSRINCFPNNHQEPYVMVKKEKGGIRFSPNFINYGCNKVQFVEHLRATNHSFYLLNNAFATDITHHNSRYRQAYIDEKLSASTMKRLCYLFLDSLDVIYGTYRKTPLCYTYSSVCWTIVFVIKLRQKQHRVPINEYSYKEIDQHD